MTIPEHTLYSGRIDEREAAFSRINKWVYMAYFFLSVASAVYCGINDDAFGLVSAIGTFLIPAGLALFYRVCRLKRVHQLDFVVPVFSEMAYTFGTVLGFYRTFLLYDKIVHLLSGIFVGMLSLGLYRILKPDPELTCKDMIPALFFVFFTSVAVSGLWEIREYIVHLLTGRDVQNVVQTGVNDTMLDMISALLGTLAFLPVAAHACRERQFYLTGSSDAFIQKNRDRFSADIG